MDFLFYFSFAICVFSVAAVIVGIPFISVQFYKNLSSIYGKIKVAGPDLRKLAEQEGIRPPTNFGILNLVIEKVWGKYFIVQLVLIYIMIFILSGIQVWALISYFLPEMSKHL